MPIPRTSLRNFLALAKSTLKAGISNNERLTFVIGNESADLDSLSSSLLYAYVRSQQQQPSKTAGAPFSALYIPLTNLPAADLLLRPEFAALLPHADLTPDHLITLDDIPSAADPAALRTRLAPARTKWVLVDHNALQGALGEVYKDRVCGVIDHHDEEGVVPRETGGEPRIVARSGSCASLVVGYLREGWDALSAAAEDGDEAKGWDAQVARLALAAVLVDTSNLKAEGKVTRHDSEAVEYLEGKIRAAPREWERFSRDALFEEIDQAKKDVGKLALQDILRKDYKEWDEGEGRRLGVSSVVKPISFLLGKAAEENASQSDMSSKMEKEKGKILAAALKEFAKRRDLNAYALMTTSTSEEGEFRRELLVWALDERMVKAMEKFAEDSREELGLERWNRPEAELDFDCEAKGTWRRVWWQKRVEHSRKRVAPLLREAML